MKSIRLTKNLRPALKALALLGLIATLYAPLVEAQPGTDQQTNRLIAHPESIKTLPSPSKRWALLIGVDRYEDSNIGPLRGAANDANSLKDALIRYAGFPEDQVIVLSTNEPPERRPTRTNILKRLSNLSGLVPKDGMLLVSFAGHGIDRNGRAFLIPSDATLTEDLGLLEETAVSVNHVKQRIKDTGVQQVMILLDACRAYPTGRSDSPNPLTPAFTNAFSFDTRNHEVVAFAVLYATAVGYRAYEYGEKRQGYFSWAIAQALSGAAANHRGEVTLQALVQYLENTVPKLVALDYGSKVIQKPFAEIGGYRASELVISVATSSVKKAPVTSPEPVNLGPSNLTNDGATEVKQASALKTNRGAKSGKVLVLFGTSMPPPYEENPGLLLNLTGPFLSALAKSGISSTSNLDRQISISDMSRLIRISGRLRGGDVAAGRSIPFALILQVTISVSALAPYDGLHVLEAAGTITAIDTKDGRTVAMEKISSVRGFGNTLRQAKGDVMKNVGEGVSEAFIKQVAAQAY